MLINRLECAQRVNNLFFTTLTYKIILDNYTLDLSLVSKFYTLIFLPLLNKVLLAFVLAIPLIRFPQRNACVILLDQHYHIGFLRTQSRA